MKNVLVRSTLLAGFACLAFAAAAADRKENRPVAGFSAIELAAPIKVELIQADTESLVLEGDEEVLANLETVVERGTLRIRTKSRFNLNWYRKTARATLSAKNVEALAISGSGDIDAKVLRSPALRVTVSGSGDVRIGQLDSNSLVVAVSGSGDVSVAGKANGVATSIAGSGDVKAAKLETRTAKVSIAGSGDATLWAKDSLVVSIVGSGDVRYYGDPSVSKSVIGSGSVRRLGPTPS